MQTQKIEISTRTIVFTVIFLLLLQVIWLTRELIYALFLAFIFMSALKPAVRFLSRKIPRTLSVVFVFVAAIIVISLIIGFVVPPLFSETFAFFKNLPTFLLKTFPTLYRYINPNFFSSYLPDLGQNVLTVATNLFSNLLFVVSIFFFTFYFLLDERLVKNLLERFLKERDVNFIMEIVEKTENRMGAWMWGEVILMTVIGVMSYIGLTILGVKYAFPLSIMAGLLEALPMIGPIVSAIPAFLVAAASSWFSGLSVIALYFLIQQLENNVIVPVVMKQTVGINPLLTLIALTVGGKLGGLIGAFISIPVALLIEIVLTQFLKRQNR